MGYSPWVCKELDTTEQLTQIFNRASRWNTDTRCSAFCTESLSLPRLINLRERTVPCTSITLHTASVFKPRSAAHTLRSQSGLSDSSTSSFKANRRKYLPCFFSSTGEKYLACIVYCCPLLQIGHIGFPEGQFSPHPVIVFIDFDQDIAVLIPLEHISTIQCRALMTVI